MTTDDHNNKTIYCGLYEKRPNGDVLHYITGPEGICALLVTNSTVYRRDMFYLVKDYQGSIIAAEDLNGNIMTEFSYDPWGRRRNPFDWTDYNLPWDDYGTGDTPLFTRGYTGHEHIDAYGLINMNGRIYDARLGRFLSPDNYVQSATNSQSYNRYSYCLNNPLKYTDPSGEFLGMFFWGFVFISETVSNLVEGNSNPLGKAFDKATEITNTMASANQFNMYHHGNTNINLSFSPFNFYCPTVNVSEKYGNFTFDVGVGVNPISGISLNGGIMYSDKHWEIGVSGGYGTNSYGGGASASYDGWGAGYYRSYYGDAIGPDGKPNNQTTASFKAMFNYNSITVENDKFGDHHDRWRSNAVEITIGKVTIGTNVYTNDPEGQSQKNERSRIWGFNSGIWKDWERGEVYSSPLYLGIRFGNNVERIGLNSSVFQDLFQNGMHSGWGGIIKNFGRTNYFLDYKFNTGIYLYSGYYTPYSLYGGQ